MTRKANPTSPRLRKTAVSRKQATTALLTGVAARKAFGGYSKRALANALVYAVNCAHVCNCDVLVGQPCDGSNPTGGSGGGT